jgi:hypothetical protein
MKMGAGGITGLLADGGLGVLDGAHDLEEVAGASVVVGGGGGDAHDGEPPAELVGVGHTSDAGWLGWEMEP